MTANETSILKNVKRILAIQGETKAWGQKEQIVLLSLIAEDCGMPADSKADFRELLKEHGAGANASQFRQWLESADVALLPAKAKAADSYSSL